jgi:hypothetical protein
MRKDLKNITHGEYMKKLEEVERRLFVIYITLDKLLQEFQLLERKHTKPPESR